MKANVYSPQSDVWSFGIVLFEILCREEPHVHEDVMTVGVRIRDDGLVPIIPDNCDSFWSDLMKKCWQQDASRRPVSNFQAIVEHPLTLHIFQNFETICSEIEQKIPSLH